MITISAQEQFTGKPFHFEKVGYQNRKTCYKIEYPDKHEIAPYLSKIWGDLHLIINYILYSCNALYSSHYSIQNRDFTTNALISFYISKDYSHFLIPI